MNTWIPIVVVLAIVVIVAVLRERSRGDGIEKWAKDRGLTRRFPVPPEGPSSAGDLVARLTTHGARIWGMVLEGPLDGAAVTIAEHESSEPGQKSGVWHTIAMWPIPASTEPIVIQRGRRSSLLANAAAAITAPIADAVRGPRDQGHAVDTTGGWSVRGEPLVIERWLTAEKTRALDAWPHEGAFVRAGGYGAWRTRGNISAASLEHLIGQIAAARKLLD
jgi:hypothetical protein